MKYLLEPFIDLMKEWPLAFQIGFSVILYMALVWLLLRLIEGVVTLFRGHPPTNLSYINQLGEREPIEQTELPKPKSFSFIDDKAKILVRSFVERIAAERERAWAAYEDEVMSYEELERVISILAQQELDYVESERRAKYEEPEELKSATLWTPKEYAETFCEDNLNVPVLEPEEKTNLQEIMDRAAKDRLKNWPSLRTSSEAPRTPPSPDYDLDEGSEPLNMDHD